jgi:hypothetical protein
MFSNSFSARNMGSWQPKLLISFISATLLFSGLGISPASATDPIPADGSWQALAENAEATLTELNAAVADGGGVQISGAGQLMGAIGVSGAPTGEADELCAKAGLKAISDDLEM